MEGVRWWWGGGAARQKRDMIASDARRLRLSASPLAAVYPPGRHALAGGETLTHTRTNNHTHAPLLAVLCALF